ncbi:MAG: SOS response-associated peptidase family protein [Erysipelotrichaceae bacterium]|nr:SOS response-associated peptidase family protein [Erysipelotrichaceae bacterium]
MCGRYELSPFLKDRITKQIFEKAKEEDLLDYATGEVFPGSKCLVLIPKGKGKIGLSVKSWGIPLKSLLINARIESLEEKPLYRSMKKNRCIVIANGFYEWKDKVKYHISKEDPHLYLAALYNDKDEFVILTGPAEDSMRDIHERTPVIFDRTGMLEYLYFQKDPAVNDRGLIINKVEN